MGNPLSRRQIIKTGFLAIGTSIASNVLVKPLLSHPENITDEDPWQNFKVGIASYTFRKFSVDDTIKAMKRLTLNYISIKDFHLALTSTAAERKAVIQKFKDEA